jgi:lysophospholipase L1-like esterase
MNTYIRKSLLPIAVAIGVAGCDADISGSLDTDGVAGRGDFSTFVAVGDSLSAGYADGALYRQIQENSLPYIMAQQFMLAGGGAFTQPLMPTDATGSMTMDGADLGRPDRLMLGATGDPASPASPVTIEPTQTTEINVRLSGAGTFNNMGIPGAKSFHLGPLPSGYGELTLAAIAGGTSNPYYARFASSDVATVLGDAAVQVPSFFMLWIGNNDILLYALAGGDAVDQNGADNIDPSTYGLNDITDDLVFAAAYVGAVDTLKTPTNAGLLINIPDVATIPYFTTVPYDAIPLAASDAEELNAQVAAGYNAVLDAAVGLTLIDAEEAEQRRINYSTGLNPVLISDETLVDLTALFVPPADVLVGLAQARPATPDDFILLPASTVLGVEETPGNSLTNQGVTQPLVDGDVLIPSEYDAIEAARAAYNATIKASADADPELLFLDAAALLVELNENGISYGSGGITAEFGTGGGFSLDGVHPTARGYAVIANEIFKVIGAGLDAYIPPVDPNEYTTVFYQ